MPEHKPKREIKNPPRYAINLKYIESGSLLYSGYSESPLPLSECGNFFIIESKDDEGFKILVSIPVTPDIYVVAKGI